MCKIAIIPGITNDTRSNALKLIKKLGDKMSVLPNNDGIGYSALNSKGKMFGERWKYNIDRFTTPPEESAGHKKRKGWYSKFVTQINNESSSGTYNKFGDLNLDDVAAITLHTRNATSSRDFINTHPFVDGYTSLVHNGVIGNVSELELKYSTCDSETILNEYTRHDVMNSPKSIQEVAHKLQGSYACGVFSKTDNDVHILDVFKSNTPNLSMGFVSELDTFVITTMFGDLEDSWVDRDDLPCRPFSKSLKNRVQCECKAHRD